MAVEKHLPYNGFAKSERLCSSSLIECLFAKGAKLFVFPFSVRYMLVPTASLPQPVQLLVVAPKRKLRHAVDRNRVKRLVRECYRVRKHALYQAVDASGMRLLLSIVYVQGAPIDFAQMSKKMDKLIDALVAQLEVPHPAEEA